MENKHLQLQPVIEVRNENHQNPQIYKMHLSLDEYSSSVE